MPIATAAIAGYFFLRHFNGIDCSRGAVQTDPQVINLAVLESEYGASLLPFAPTIPSLVSLPMNLSNRGFQQNNGYLEKHKTIHSAAEGETLMLE